MGLVKKKKDFKTSNSDVLLNKGKYEIINPYNYNLLYKSRRKFKEIFSFFCKEEGLVSVPPGNYKFDLSFNKELSVFFNLSCEDSSCQPRNFRLNYLITQNQQVGWPKHITYRSELGDEKTPLDQLKEKWNDHSIKNTVAAVERISKTNPELFLTDGITKNEVIKSIKKGGLQDQKVFDNASFPSKSKWDLPIFHGFIVSEKLSKEFELFHTNFVRSCHPLDLKKASNTLKSGESGFEKQRMVEDLCYSLIYHAQTETKPKAKIDKDIKVLKNSLAHTRYQSNRAYKALDNIKGTQSSKTKWLQKKKDQDVVSF